MPVQKYQLGTQIGCICKQQGPIDDAQMFIGTFAKVVLLSTLEVALDLDPVTSRCKQPYVNPK